jgi:hypothetical protein
MLDQSAVAEIPVSLPTPAAAPRNVCCECGQPFKAVRSHQLFCSKEHAKTFQNRQLAEGRAVIALAKAWRVGRNVKGSTPEAEKLKRTASEALTELCSVLDFFIANDRDEGRPNPLVYAKGLLRSGRYIDRQHRGR